MTLTTFSGRRPSQNEQELSGFVALLVEHGVRKYLEVGAREGDTVHFVVSNVPSIEYALAIDLPGGLWGKKSTGAQLALASAALKADGRACDYLLADSTTEAAQRVIAEHGPYDAILIDGDHTYEGVKADWEAYGNLAPIVAFHDIVGHDQSEKVSHRAVEVPRLWAEIKASGRKTVEFIAPGSAMGIGVVLSA